ncbi:MAG: response regulator [Magnetococcales bacterium]|nr:response regulator [Magnetococcales bacterium]
MARILVIDDDIGVRALMRVILEDAGHVVVEAPNGRLGIKRYRENPADLVITDMVMPEKDGVEVIVELMEQDTTIKVVAMSGGGRGLEADYNLGIAKDFGAVRTLAKPFSRQQVLQVVKDLLPP